jgi:hypothetical protein
MIIIIGKDMVIKCRRSKISRQHGHKNSSLGNAIAKFKFRGKFKDLSLASSIGEWSGSDKGRTITESIMQIEHCALVSHWSEGDECSILKAKLCSEALQFVMGRDDLKDPEVTDGRLTQALTERFSGKLLARNY